MPPSRRNSLVIASLLALLAVPEARALIIYGTGPTDVDNTLNTTAPANGAPWANVVQFGTNNAGGVYLGHGYVLTANHVNVVDSGIVINGISYARDTSFEPLHVSEDSAETAYPDVVDLKLVRILGNPDFPALPVVQKLPLNDSTTADLNTACTMISWGVGKGTIVTNQGWTWGNDGTRAERWATNTTRSTTAQATYSVNANYNYEALATRFRRSLGSDTGQVANGDSGGGLYQQFSGTWKLSGIMTSTLSYQSGAALYDGDTVTPLDQPDESQYVRISRYAHLLRYENWAKLKLGSATAADTDDADNDGVSNLIEYAQHTDPASASSRSEPVIANEPGFVSLTYTRLMSATDLQFTVEATDSLNPVDWQPATVTEEVVSNSGVAWTIKAKVALSTETRKFLRLRVTRLP